MEEGYLRMRRFGSQKWRNWCVGREGMVLPEREEKRKEAKES